MDTMSIIINVYLAIFLIVKLALHKILVINAIKIIIYYQVNAYYAIMM